MKSALKMPSTSADSGDMPSTKALDELAAQQLDGVFFRAELRRLAGDIAYARRLPLVATSHAFRGMNFDAASLGNVVLADDAAGFAAALAAAAKGAAPTARERATSPSRRAYDAHFSEQAYARQLAEVAGPLVQ